MDFTKIEKKLNISFNDKALLKQAFTHRSFLNENRNSGLLHNERLEFLGDAVLELVVTDYLYKKYPSKPEGELTALRSALVNSQMIATVSSELDFNDHLLLSRGEAKDTGRARQYILANTFESVIGAIYLDKGYKDAAEFITGSLLPKIKEVEEQKLFVDAKSYFQEKSQEFLSITPNYKTVKESGPDHDKIFTVALFIGETKVVEGQGRSKQEAEQDAARKGIVSRGW